MNDKEYFSLSALSKSQIKNWDPHDPMQFWNKSAFNPNKSKDEITDYTVTGKLYHMMTLQRDKVMDSFTVDDSLGISRKK